jgi:mannose-6-phosphate isomerase-like protein (cupin superfamily)
VNKIAIALISSLVLLPLVAYAQPAPGPSAPARPAQTPLPATQDPTIFISAGEIAERMAMAYAMEKAGVRDTGPYALMKQPPFVVTMEYRVRPDGHYSVHTRLAEMFLVMDGSATITVGGKLIDPQHQGPDDLSGRGMEGGTPYKLHKGDILLVPPNSVHSVTQVDEKFAAMSVHIPLASPDMWPNNTREYIKLAPQAAPAGR